MTSDSNPSRATSVISLVRVVIADRHSWGFELELECGHGQFHFTDSAKTSAPDAVACLECDAGARKRSQ